MSLSFLIHLVAFVAAVSLLVTVHEFGHYWVARRLGFKVLRFSVGFGRALWTRVAGADRTEYVIAAVPLGGYVKMLDEREGPVAAAELSRSFTRRPHWQRIAVLLAGPAFNIGFAIILLTAVYLIAGVSQIRPVLGNIDPASVVGKAGFKPGDEIVAIDTHPVHSEDETVLGLLDAVSGNAPLLLSARGTDGAIHTASLDVPPGPARLRLTEPEAMLPSLGLRFFEPSAPAVLGTLVADGPAVHAGLAPGDQVLAINGEAVRDWQDLQTRIEGHPNDSIVIRYQRAGVESSVRVQTQADTVDGKLMGRIRAYPTATPLPASMIRHINLSVPAALMHASVDAWDMTALQGRLFWRMLIGQVSIKNLSGPLSIAQYAGDSALLGLLSFLRFLVIVSLALGFMNLLPIPILDGGQIVFQTIEWLKGSPLSERFQMIGQQLGMALLVLLMGVALFNDISRQFG